MVVIRFLVNSMSLNTSLALKKLFWLLYIKREIYVFYATVLNTKMCHSDVITSLL